MPTKFIRSIGRTLDARPDRLDLRDREFTPGVVSLPEQWPDDASIRRLLPQYRDSGLILDQDKEGACTGFGLACVVNYLCWRATLSADRTGKQSDRSRLQPQTVSARMLYHLARFYDEWPGEDYEGSSCRGALKAWHKHGVCTESLWPYRDDHGNVKFIQPSDGWAEDALQRRLGVYYRVNRASVVDMQAAILEIGAIYVSSSVHDGWGITVRDGKLTGHASLPVIKPIRNPDSLGGHAYALVGFNRIGFIVQNSWSERWGNGGFGVLPYEEWVQYGTDAWTCALGVPASQKLQGRSPSVPVRSREQIVLARAGGLAFTSTAKAPPPQVTKEVARLSVEQAYQHTIVMGNDGQVINRIVTLGNAQDAVNEIACRLPAAGFGSKPKRLVIYAHGGLNSEDASIERIQTLAPYFQANGVYPVFLTWKTGPIETLTGIVDDELKKVPRPEGGELLDRFKETMAEALDRTIEVLARPAAKPIWSQMRQNAAASAEAGRGCVLLADALAALQQQTPQLEIHLVGHSAGSIILGHLLDLLPGRNLKIASCHLYAPACTVRFALDHYVPAIEQGVLGSRRLHLHLLSEANELGDTVGPYQKSLLYLVSRALESCHKMPILGLAQAFDAKNNPKWHDSERDALKTWQRFWNATGNALNVVSDQQVSTGTHPQARRIAAAHGSFDNDATTITSTLKRIVGAKPPFAVEWIDY